MNIRKLVVSLLKRNTYKKIEKNLNILEGNINNPKEINTKRLDNFLSFSIENSKYYKSMRISNICDFPILTKETLKKNYKDVATIPESEFKKYDVLTTSGSTGTPFQFSVTKEKKISRQAQILFFGSYSHFDIGTKHAVIRSIKPSLLRIIFKNQFVIVPDKMDYKWASEALEIIKNKKVKVIVGYPSGINMMAIILKKHDMSISTVEGIITSGEKLTEDMKQNIKSVFGVTPHSRYATEEFGIIANEYGESFGFKVNQVDFLVEVLNDDLSPVNEGESGKVVVTDFKSNLVPLIRYDTGDIATVKSYKEGLVHEFLSIDGREIDTIYNVNGVPVSGFTINNIMQKYPDILQFQFIQHSKFDYEMKIQPLDAANHFDYSKSLNFIHDTLGNEANLELNIVSEIPTSKSGKRPYVINKMI